MYYVIFSNAIIVALIPLCILLLLLVSITVFSNLISSFLRQKLTEHGSLALAATTCKRIVPSPKSDVVGVRAAPKPICAARALTAERIALYSNSLDGL